jgi:membrane-bound lytic murein transglycosylase D
MRRVTFRAGRRGDTVAAIAKRYRVDDALVAHWNDVEVGASFRSGQNIVVMVPIKPAKGTPKATASASARPISRGQVANKR